MVSKPHPQVAALSSISRENWRSMAGRLVLVALLVVALAARAEQISSSLHTFATGAPVPRTTYLPRFTEIAAAEGRPYRQFPVEYPPVSLGAIELVAGSDANQTGIHLVWLMVVCDLLTAAALAFGWGRRAAVSYLVLTVPLLGFLYMTIDLLSAALAVGAVALLVRGRERVGGVALAAGVLAKVWPFVLGPLMVLERKRRAFVWWVGFRACCRWPHNGTRRDGSTRAWSGRSCGLSGTASRASRTPLGSAPRRGGRRPCCSAPPCWGWPPSGIGRPDGNRVSSAFRRSRRYRSSPCPHRSCRTPT
jgi:hypothetical protein